MAIFPGVKDKVSLSRSSGETLVVRSTKPNHETKTPTTRPETKKTRIPFRKSAFESAKNANQNELSRTIANAMTKIATVSTIPSTIS